MKAITERNWKLGISLATLGQRLQQLRKENLLRFNKLQML